MFLKLFQNKNGAKTQKLSCLAQSLVRSRLTYAQESFFSAPKHLLKKLQSVDCKAFKWAIGVSFHTSNLGTYKAEIIPLDLPEVGVWLPLWWDKKGPYTQKSTPRVR